MENIQLILSMLVTIIGFFISTITFLSKYIKNANAKKKLSSMVRLGEALIPFIEEAEKFVNYSGSEKKTYVITRMRDFALNNKMKFDYEQVNDKIEELVELSKIVNPRSNNKPLEPLIKNNQIEKGVS